MLKAVQLGAADISDISRKQANVEKRARPVDVFVMTERKHKSSDGIRVKERFKCKFVSVLTDSNVLTDYVLPQ
jgi:hypothetical protein